MSDTQATSRSHSAARRSSPAELERQLRIADAQKALAPEVKNRVTGELMQLRRRLEQLTCSSAWMSHCWQTGDQFPPPAETTPMQACQCERCARTGKLWPQHYGSPPAGAVNGHRNGFLSYECYLESLSDEQAAHLPSSPSGLALRAIREGRIKLRRQRTHTAARRYTA